VLVALESGWGVPPAVFAGRVGDQIGRTPSATVNVRGGLNPSSEIAIVAKHKASRGTMATNNLHRSL
jgi:hypothetical protein